MTLSEEFAVLEFSCERCNRGFVPPQVTEQTGLAGEYRVLRAKFARALHPDKRPGVKPVDPRRQLMVQAQDEAYRTYLQSVHFCPGCRQFVCHECWASSNSTCLTCVAKAMTRSAMPVRPLDGVRLRTTSRPPAPVAPVKQRGRGHGVPRVALAATLVLLLFGGGAVLALGAMPRGAAPSQAVAGSTDAPSASQPAATHSAPSATATPGSTATDAATASTGASPTAGETGKPGPTATGPKKTTKPGPTPTPAPTPPPAPTDTPTPPPAPTDTPTA